MSTEAIKTFEVRLITRGFYAGTVEAGTEADAIDQAFHIWRTECPHPFEKFDDDELEDVIVECEVLS